MKLHQYQLDCVDHLSSNPRAGLLLEMGLGKTATTLTALEDHHFPVLVIAPKRVTSEVWPAEVAKWRPDLTQVVANGTPKHRLAMLNSGADLVSVGRENIKDVVPGQFKTVILDELSSFKNYTSIRWKLAKKICAEADTVWGLTGTPASNGYMDLWAQIYLLDQGARLGKNITAYRNRFFRVGRQLSNGVVTEWILRDGAAEKILSLISDICISMKSADYLDLPPVTYNQVLVPLEPRHRKIYEDMVKTLVADLRVDGDGEVHTAANAAVLTGKLSQITAGFLYPDLAGEPTTHLHSNKVQAVQEIIDGTGSPVLVFYRFVEELAALQAALPQAMTVKDKDVFKLWDEGRCPVLLSHPLSVGHGLNLQRGGHTVIWSTPTWSQDEYAQANARVARQGQTRPVVVHLLLSPDTVDFDMLHAVEGKTRVQDGVMNALRL